MQEIQLQHVTDSVPLLFEASGRRVDLHQTLIASSDFVVVTIEVVVLYPFNIFLFLPTLKQRWPYFYSSWRFVRRCVFLDLDIDGRKQAWFPASMYLQHYNRNVPPVFDLPAPIFLREGQKLNCGITLDYKHLPSQPVNYAVVFRGYRIEKVTN